MGLFRTMKMNARRVMAGAWGRGVALLLIAAVPAALIRFLEFGLRQAGRVQAYVGTSGSAFESTANISAASNIIASLMGLLVFVIMTPLLQGVIRWYYRRTGGENEGVSAAFSYFETADNYFRSLWLQILISVRIVFWVLLLLIPVIVYAALAFIYGPQLLPAETPPALNAFSWLLTVIWTVLASVFFCFLSLRYFLAPYLLAEHPDIKAGKAIRQGVRIVKGHKGSLFTFGLSFIGWWAPAVLAALLIVSIPFVHPYYTVDLLQTTSVLVGVQALLSFYVLPYMQAAYALYARYLIQRGERLEEEQFAGETREYSRETEPLPPGQLDETE